MRDGRLVVSASDLVGHLDCPHLTTLSLEVLEGRREPPPPADAESEALSRRGLEHEDRHLEDLRRDRRRVVEITDGAPPVTQEAVTLRALAEGADVVYQGTFFDGDGPGPAWHGHIDFLHRVGELRDAGGARYEPEEAKLARHLRPSAVLQLCVYAEQLERLQGHAPELVHVVLGDGTRRSLRLADYASYYRAVKRRFLDALELRTPTSPERCSHCSRCRWLTHCESEWNAARRLTLVAGLTSEQERKLGRAGISTIDQLAAGPEPRRVTGMREPTLVRLRRQASLQVAAGSRDQGELPYELLEPTEEAPGLAGLPEPSPGDLFFDIESDPWVGEDGLEYLFGVGWIGERGFEHTALWAHDRAAEKRSFERLVDLVAEHRRRHPGMHVYHYASYEPSALKRLMGRYGTREDEVDSMLRDGVLVDLFRVVRQGVAVGSASYSLKSLEPLYMERRSGEISDGASSVAAYEEWLGTADPERLREIEAYNRTDCESTWRLREWLEARRCELASGTGREVARPLPPRDEDGDAEEPENTAGADEARRLTDLLAADVDGIPDESTLPDVTARWLLGQLLQWHRREDKPAWWRFFERVGHASQDDLFEDPEAVAGLVYEGVVGEKSRSLVHRYRFDPSQECRLAAHQDVADPFALRAARREGKRPGPGSLEGLDAVEGCLDLKRKRGSPARHPLALIPAGPIKTGPLREALVRLGEHVLAHGLEGPGPWRAGRDLLLGRPPRLRGGVEAGMRTGEDVVEAVVRLAADLDESYLPVQGPPGSGKTWAAACLVVSLVASGRRVGVTAHTHAAITHLLSAVVDRAAAEGVRLRALQKPGTKEPDAATERAAGRWVIAHNGDIESAVSRGEADVVAGTPWLFARPGLHGAFDHLVLDEAGQLSLANALAVSGAASNLVLFGDHRQLAQPSAGSHPPGAGASALEHVLGQSETITSDQGVFLDRTFRLHPDICEFVSEVVYEGRLHSSPACAGQSVGPGPLVEGSGLRFVPVHHAGDRTSSAEEASAVRRIYEALLGRPWTDEGGRTSRLGPEDILVVAPYNAQVALLHESLPEGARVGTVDRFQGQEAPVALVSMAASSPAEVPRGLDFLLSLNRLNVAVSRARALSVLVASPQLVAPGCRTLEQMRLANALCRYVELAQTVVLPEMLQTPAAGTRA